VKTRLLFLIKFLGYSLCLFIVWQPVSDIYSSSFYFVICRIHSATSIEASGFFNIIKEMFVYLIPLISLILATPKVKIKRKAIGILSGILLFLCSDVILFELVINIYDGQLSKLDESPVIWLYNNLRWLLPFLLWFITCYSSLNAIFRPQKLHEQITALYE
jgi:hypothetical protein